MNRRPLRCLLTRKFWERDIAYLREHVKAPIEFVIPEKFTTEAMVEAMADGVDVLLGDVPNASVVEAARGIQLLQIPWTGLDNVDWDLLRKHAFAVCNSHGNAQAVAELGMALLLSAMKQIPSHHAALQQGNWRRPGAPDCIMPDLLADKKAAVLGYGAVGKRLAKMLGGFGVTVCPMASVARQEEGRAVEGYERLDALCAECDLIMITLPLTPQTQGAVGPRQLASMKRTAYVVNLSRGAIIDEEAFYLALKERRIAGAAVDVWYQYPQRGHSGGAVSRFPFEELDNVVMSPHRGGMIRDELPHLTDVVENLNRLAAGEPLINRVDPTKGY